MKKKIVALILGAALCMVTASCAGKEKSDDEERHARKESMNEAEELFSEGKYQESLQQWIKLMEESERDDSDIYAGMVRCQIFLGNYQTAADDIEYYVAEHRLNSGIGALYLELFAHTGDYGYYQKGIGFCEGSFTEEGESIIPPAPEITPESGSYDHAVSLTFDSDNPKDSFYYCIMRYDPYDYTTTSYGEWMEYKDEIELLPGETDLKAYTVRNGVAGEVTEVYYTIAYEGNKLQFADPLMEKIVRAHIRKDSCTDTDLIALDKLNMENWIEDSDEAGAKKLKSLEDLKWMPNLTYLLLDERQEVKDFSPIGSCTKLRSLCIRGYKGEDLTFLEKLHDLRILSISGDNIDSLNALESCKDLQNLHLEGVDDPKQLTYLESLDKLLVLELVNCEATADTQLMDELRRELPMCDIKY